MTQTAEGLSAWRARTLRSMSRPDPPPAPDVREIEFYEDLAWRLKLAVEAIDRPKGEIAESIGVSQSRLSNWITAQNKPDWYGVARLCRRYGISAEWILLGDVRNLDHQKADNWERAAAERQEARQAPAPRGRGRG